MSYYSGGGGYSPAKVNYLPNIDPNLLATVRDEMLRKEEEQKREQQRREVEQRKVTEYLTQLQALVRSIPSKYKGKFTYDVLADVATSLLDGTVFEIVKGLEDIQQLTERNLLNKRMKVINSHKVQRMEQAKKHKEEIEKNQHRPHHIPIVEKTNEEDKEKLEQRLETEITSMDQKLVLELDQIVCDQQATLERAGVPLFFVTNNPDDVRLQRYLLEFIQQLIPGPS